MNLSILFPMAGNGMRFGGTFKPFLDATEKKFIELAVEPFSIYERTYNVTYVFIYRRDQEERYHVRKQLDALFPSLAKRIIILENETLGPLDTIRTACRIEAISGQVIICDCDHSIPQEEMKVHIDSNTYDVIIPTWRYTPADFSSWSKVSMTLERNLIGFHEKEKVSESHLTCVEGMIGAHYIRDIKLLDSDTRQGNLSEHFTILLKQGKSFHCVLLNTAYFFGTPSQLTAFRFDRAKKQTFFVDIDGTLIHLSQRISYASDPGLIIPGTIEKLSEWRQQGHSIVLVTGREESRRPLLEKQLRDLCIPYNQLVTGLPSGPRVMINDKKPYCLFLDMSHAVQLRRNEGISRIVIPTTPTLLKTLHGGSFAHVFLIELDGVKRVRKYIEKRPESTFHVDVVRRQYDDMKRLEFYCPNLVPNMLCSTETSDAYYYDMEYMEGYVELNSCSNDVITSVIKKLTDKLCHHVYVYKGPVDGKKWMENYVSEKIKAKYKTIEACGPLFYRAMNDAFVVINGTSYKGLCHYFATEDLSQHEPLYVSPIHGDLTLNNILYHPTRDEFRLIDPAGSRFVDAIELDMSKLLQDVVAKVHTWPSRGKLVTCNDEGEFTLPNELMETDNTFDFVAQLYGRSVKTAHFYLATHLIRMIPYAHVSSPDHALCALLYALSHM
jgi:hypothetical protein